MKHRITITADRHESPDLDRIVACLLALALARLEAEKEPRTDPSGESRKESGD
ncbi:MAG: hypothetical protein ACJ75S_02900 [Solirubrobacterales bacterium]